MTFAAIWRDLEIIILKWSKPDREKQISYDIAYMWNLKKMKQMNLFTTDSQTEKTNIVTKEKGG